MDTAAASSAAVDASTSKYDPNAVIAAANEQVGDGKTTQNWQSGQFLFQSALLEWTDDAREMNDKTTQAVITEALATLWLGYAQYLIQHKQYKSAGEAYDEAMSSPVTCHVGRIYAEAARFALERNKRKTAQNIYVKALVGGSNDNNNVKDEQDCELLWNDFYNMMKEMNPELSSISELQTAVQEQHYSSTGGPQSSALDDDEDNTDDQQPVSKRPKLSSTSTSPVPAGPLDGAGKNNNHSGSGSKTHVVTMDTVQERKDTLLQELATNLTTSNKSHGMPPEMMAEWISRDGTYPPQPPQITLFGNPSPPKLSDPTAKDILGIDLSLQLVERLLDPASGGVLLEVCRALWTLTALYEQQSNTRLEKIDDILMKDHETLESELEARLSVVGHQEAMADAVRKLNNDERRNFQESASRKRQNVLNDTAWKFRKLLYWQQHVLAQLDVPGFAGEDGGPTLDTSTLQLQSQICLYLHSAFYIRNRIGADPHISMLKSQLKKLQKEQAEGGGRGGGGTRSPMPGGALSPVPPMRYSPVPPPQPMYMPPPQQQQQPPPSLPPAPPQQILPPPIYHGQPSHMMVGAGMQPPQQQLQQYGYPGQPPPHPMMMGVGMPPMQQQQQQQQPMYPQQQQAMMAGMPPMPPNAQPPPYGNQQQQQQQQQQQPQQPYQQFPPPYYQQ